MLVISEAPISGAKGFYSVFTRVCMGRVSSFAFAIP